jgi:hypothetical protein
MRKLTIALFAMLLVTALVGVSAAQTPVRLSKEGRPVELSVVPQNALAEPGAWQTTGPVSLIVDDGTAENFIGLNDGTFGYQYLWLNQFTPDSADYPFQLEQISVIFGSTGVPLGGAVDLVVYEDTTGGDPSDAVWLATYPVTVLANDGVTWSNYTLSTPLALNGPGDVLIGAINRYIVSGVTPKDYPAGLDTSPSQQRSWVAAWNLDPPSPPTLPPDSLWGLIDDFGFAGNWTIRGSGQTMGENTMTCGSIGGWGTLDPFGRRVVKWKVTVVDQAAAPLGDVAVTADLTWPAGGPVTRTRMSHLNGVANFHWGSNVEGTWTIDVTNMVKEGYTFVDGPQCYAEGYFK